MRLGQLPTEEVKSAAAEFLLTGVYSHLLSSGQHPRTHLVVVIDEAHRIANLDATELLLREARAFGYSILLSSQEPTDFDDIIYQNAGTVISLMLSAQKAARAAAPHVKVGDGEHKRTAQELRDLAPFEALIRSNHYRQTAEVMFGLTISASSRLKKRSKSGFRGFRFCKAKCALFGLWPYLKAKAQPVAFWKCVVGLCDVRSDTLSFG